MGEDSNSEVEFYDTTKELTNLIQKCKKFVPECYSEGIGKRKEKLRISGLKTNDEACGSESCPTPSRLRQTAARDQRKYIEDTFNSLSSQLENINAGISVFRESLLSIYDDLDIFNARLIPHCQAPPPSFHFTRRNGIKLPAIQENENES